MNGNEKELDKISEHLVNEIIGEIVVNFFTNIADDEKDINQIINDEYDVLDKSEILNDISNVIINDMPGAFDRKGININKIKNIIMETQKDISYTDMIWRVGALTCSAYSWFTFLSGIYRDPVSIEKLIEMLALLKMK